MLQILKVSASVNTQMKVLILFEYLHACSDFEWHDLKRNTWKDIQYCSLQWKQRDFVLIAYHSDVFMMQRRAYLLTHKIAPAHVCSLLPLPELYLTLFF